MFVILEEYFKKMLARVRADRDGAIRPLASKSDRNPLAYLANLLQLSTAQASRQSGSTAVLMELAAGDSGIDDHTNLLGSDIHTTQSPTPVSNSTPLPLPALYFISRPSFPVGFNSCAIFMKLCQIINRNWRTSPRSSSREDKFALIPESRDSSGEHATDLDIPRDLTNSRRPAREAFNLGTSHARPRSLFSCHESWSRCSRWFVQNAGIKKLSEDPGNHNSNNSFTAVSDI